MLNEITKLQIIRWRKITKEYLNKKQSSLFCEGSSLHPAYSLYKYEWWVFSSDSKYETAGEVFFNKKYKLTTKQAINLMDQLDKKGIYYAYVNIRIKRLGNKIWDYEKLKKEYPDMRFAPAYEDDMDECWELHK